MKKAVSALMASIMALCLLAGCAARESLNRFTVQDDIVTYTRIDPERTQLTVSSLGINANISSLAAAFERQNPDVQIIKQDLTGGTVAYRPVVDWITNGVAPDVMFVNPDTFIDDAVITEYLEDLSADPVIASFESEALNRLAIDGFVYFLPAPSEINCIIYNKTLFEQYGWEAPTTFDEFVALCVQIKEDTNGAVQPWNPNAKYDNVLTTALEALTYGELFGGVENRSWYNKFCDGKATFAGHMEPFYDMVQTLIDNGILLEEHFDYSATARGKEFEAGSLAMYNAPIFRMESDKFEFDYMPYPATDGEIGYVSDYFSSMLCVPKKERTEAEQDAINRFIAFFGSLEGQQALIGDTLMVSNVKGVPLNESKAMAGIEEVIAQGRKFVRLDFPGSGDVNWMSRGDTSNCTAEELYERNWSFRDNALAMVKGEKTGAEIIAEIDAAPYKVVGDHDAETVKLGEVSENFTVLEFSCYIADMYRETAEADVGLINHGIPYRGNLVRLFAGDIYDDYMYPIRPRSFANGSTLVKLSMTGQQIMDALDHPVGYSNVSNSIYAFSGLKCEVAPWNELGSKYISVKLADGSELEADKLYTVAAWEGSVADEYITETLEAHEGTWDELMAAKLAADGTIAPAHDGRITLVWE